MFCSTRSPGRARRRANLRPVDSVRFHRCGWPRCDWQPAAAESPGYEHGGYVMTLYFITAIGFDPNSSCVIFSKVFLVIVSQTCILFSHLIANLISPCQHILFFFFTTDLIHYSFSLSYLIRPPALRRCLRLQHALWHAAIARGRGGRQV